MTRPKETPSERSRPGVRRQRRTAARADPDRGSSPVEFAIIAAVMLMMGFAVIQVGLLWHARSIALGAATQGVNAGRGFSAPPGTADTAATGFLDQAGDGLADQRVTVTATADEVRVTVTGTAISVLPGVRFTVSQSAHGSREQPT